MQPSERYHCGFSFSFDQHSLVQEAFIALRNSGLRVFMYDAEPPESGVLWENLRSNYLSCDRIVAFVNSRYLTRPVTRREFQLFAAEATTRWKRSDIHAFVDEDAQNSTLLTPQFFTRHSSGELPSIARILASQS